MKKGLLPNMKKLAERAATRKSERPTLRSRPSPGPPSLPGRTGAAQHLRLSRPGQTELLAASFVDPYRSVEKSLKIGPLQNSAAQARGAAPPEIEAVLVDSGRAPNLEHGAARSHHVSAGTSSTARSSRRCASRSSRHPGHVPPLYDPPCGKRSSKKAGLRFQLEKNGTRMERPSKVRRTSSVKDLPRSRSRSSSTSTGRRIRPS